MIGHLGPRVSALLDGQLPPAEAEEAWNHVYACHACRDLVEREGWVKTRLAGLSGETPFVPDGLRGSLLNLPPGDQFLADARADRPGRRGLGAVAIGGGAVGAAMMGVLALGLAPASAPGPEGDRRIPASQIDTPNVSTPQAGAPTSAPASLPARATATASAPALGIPDGAVPAWVLQLLP
ncbi:MAG TPA: hypothetical protein VD859_09810 [Nocardioides sp.]|nr:hypothetical protein [Nocardioides sp.]